MGDVAIVLALTVVEALVGVSLGQPWRHPFSLIQPLH
jgi:hypothetical protein